MEGAGGVDDVDDDDVSGAACACGAPFSSFWLSICESDLDSSPLLSSCLSLLLLLLSSLSAGVITPFSAWLFAALVSPASTEDADSGVLMSSVRDGVCSADSKPRLYRRSSLSRRRQPLYQFVFR